MPFGQTSVRDLSDPKLVERVENDYKNAQEGKSNSNTRCLRYKQLYEALDLDELAVDESSGLIEEDEDSQADINMPVGSAIVDSAVAKLFNSFFSTEEYMRIEPTEFEDGFVAHKITAHMKKRHKEMKFRRTVFRILQQAGCYDFCVSGMTWMLKPGFENRRKKEVTYKTYGALKFPFQKVTVEPVWIPDAVDRPHFFDLDFFRCWPDPNSKLGFEDSEFFIDDRDEQIENLVAQAKTKEHPWQKYKNIGNVLKILKETQDAHGNTASQNLDTNSTVPEDSQSMFSGRRVKVIRYWTPHHVVEICLGQVIWRMDLSGYPLQLWSITDKPRGFGGMGLLQRIERNLIDINASLNARRNFQNLISDPFMVIDQSLIGQFKGEPRVSSGKVLVSSGGIAKDKIHIHVPGVNINQDAMGDVAMQISMIERATGVSENDQAAYASGRRSATETGRVAFGADMRTFVIARLMEEGAMEPAFMEQFKLEQLYMTRSDRFTYYGRHGNSMMVINPADYKWASQPGFTAMGAMSLANDAVENAQFLSMIQLAMQLPQVPHNWINVMTEAWRRFAPKNYEEFITDPNVPQENIPPEIENRMIAQGQRARISPLNIVAEHLASHKQVKLTPDYKLWPESFRMELDRHIQETEAGLQQVVSQIRPSEGTQDGADAIRGIRPSTLRAP